METQDAVELGRTALITALLLGSPALVVGLAVSLCVGLLQAVTQVQEPTISFVVKLVTITVALSLCLPWLVELMMEYAEEMFTSARWLSGPG
jgi:flagellar biosynthesis protein FliQ